VKLRFAGLILVLFSIVLPTLAQVKGSGTVDYIPLWTATTTIGNSELYQSGGNVGIKTTSPAWALDVSGRINTSDAYKIGDLTVLAHPGGTDGGNVALGNQALPTSTTVYQNTALGDYALYSDISGGQENTAAGFESLYSNTTGYANTGIGYGALNGNTTGYLNIAIGLDAGSFVSGGNSYNIEIGNPGDSGDSGTIRIGTSGKQTSFFAAGVSGVTTGDPDAVPVLIDTNGQLGTISSSRRYKIDIQDMGEVSRDLMRLRPVTFRYEKPFADGSRPIQYGLIAEEVAEVNPNLVAHSADGQIETVKYQLLDPMLLNEVQRQQAEIGDLQERLKKMEAALAAISHTSEPH
jgi:hypothetical protein